MDALPLKFRPLPLPVRTKLINASQEPKNRRMNAINEAMAWGKLHYPEYFIETQGNEPVAYKPTYACFKIIDTPLDLKNFIKKEN